MIAPFERKIVSELADKLARMPSVMHVIVGPRQVGKTTAAQQLAARFPGPVHYAAADQMLPPEGTWIVAHWDEARRLATQHPALLVLDEIQKVPRWSEVVKGQWDADRLAGTRLGVLILGSSALLLSHGLSESMAGRFLLHRFSHWSAAECEAAFGFTVDDWILYGGYPGAAPLVSDVDLWRRYVQDALIETVLARDVMGLHAITKPTLLRHLFGLATRYPAQILSYNKMLGQLTEAGNTTTLADYLHLLTSAFLLSGLEKYSAGSARKRGSSPKLVLWNSALVTATSLEPPDAWRRDPSRWGRLVENAVGAHLLNHLQALPYEVTYWRHRNDEVDYVVRGGERLWAIEVKSGRPDRLRGLEAFCRQYPTARPIILGAGGIPLESFFSLDPRELLT